MPRPVGPPSDLVVRVGSLARRSVRWSRLPKDSGKGVFLSMKMIKVMAVGAALSSALWLPAAAEAGGAGASRLTEHGARGSSCAVPHSPSTPARFASWPNATLPALQAAGVEHRRIYDMRHTFVTWNLAAGMSGGLLDAWARNRPLGTEWARFRLDGDETRKRRRMTNPLLLRGVSASGQCRARTGDLLLVRQAL